MPLKSIKTNAFQEVTNFLSKEQKFSSKTLTPNSKFQNYPLVQILTNKNSQ